MLKVILLILATSPQGVTTVHHIEFATKAECFLTKTTLNLMVIEQRLKGETARVTTECVGEGL